MIKLSVIIPTFNESDNICKLLDHLLMSKTIQSEIIVADGGSSDGTLTCCKKYPSIILLKCPKKGRAAQMKHALKVAKGTFFYFIHADTLPPSSWESDIKKSTLNNCEIGGFRFKFDSNRPLLKFNSWMTRINISSFRGGDQSFFVSKTCYNQIGGFSDVEIMEEYDLFRKAKRKGYNYCLIQKDTLVSARKYDNNSYLRVNIENFLAMVKFKLGVSDRKIKERYSRKISR